MSDEQADTLAARAAALARGVAALNEQVAELNRRQDRSRRIVAITVAGLVLDLFLSGVVFFGLFAQSATDRRLEALIVRQDEIRSQALCPLYALFLRAYNPDSPQAKADRITYDRNFAQIRRSYGVLQCPDPVPDPVPR